MFLQFMVITCPIQIKCNKGMNDSWFNETVYKLWHLLLCYLWWAPDNANFSGGKSNSNTAHTFQTSTTQDIA